MTKPEDAAQDPAPTREHAYGCYVCGRDDGMAVLRDGKRPLHPDCVLDYLCRPAPMRDA